jgi:Flp pilus assembly pilin Flp
VREEVRGLLRRIGNWLLQVRGSERGEVYVEYVVLGSLAVLVILGAVEYFFNAVSALFQKIGGALGGL